MFPVAAQAQQLGDDHLRSPARSGLADRVAYHFEAGRQVGAFRGVSADPVPGGLVQERAAGKLPIGRSGIGVVVIGHDQHQRQFLDGGLVDGFVKGAGGRGAVANAGRADRAGDSLEAMGHQGTVHDGNHRAQMADHHEQPFLGPAPVDVAVARAHRAQGRAQISPHRIQNRLTKSQPSGPVPNQRGEDVSLAQSQSNGHAQRFLASAQEDAAVDFAHAIEARKLVIQQARQEHKAVSPYAHVTE